MLELMLCICHDNSFFLVRKNREKKSSWDVKWFATTKGYKQLNSRWHCKDTRHPLVYSPVGWRLWKLRNLFQISISGVKSGEWEASSIFGRLNPRHIGVKYSFTALGGGGGAFSTLSLFYPTDRSKKNFILNWIFGLKGEAIKHYLIIYDFPLRLF